MKRAAWAVQAAEYHGRGLPAIRFTRSATSSLALLGALLAAGAGATSVAGGDTAAPQHSAATVSRQLPLAAWGAVSAALGRNDPAYRATRDVGGLVARNPRQQLTTQFSSDRVSIRSGQTRLVLRLRAYGYGNSLNRVPAVAPSAIGNRVLYRNGQLNEWYANGPLGLEQGFTLAARPAAHGSGPLTLALSLSGNARTALVGGAVTLSYRGSSLTYRGLIATDARGRTLPAWLQLRGDELLLRVNDAAARYPLRIDPFLQQAKLTASDGAVGDLFGVAAAIQGDTLVASAPGATVNGNASQGAVYVFIKPKTGWANAIEAAKLTASDGAANEELGFPESLGSTGVAISGNTIVAGASGATVNGNPGQGAVYVFIKPREGWHSETETAKLTASNGSAAAYFGSPVAISGDTVVAGAELAGVSFQGAAYVFVKPKGGWRSGTETARLIASDNDPGDTFGDSAAIQGNTIVIGANDGGNGGGPGAAYVFLKPSGGWRTETEAAKLTASDGVAGDTLGTSVAIDRGTVIAGEDDEITGAHSGAVYVFLKPGDGWRSETQTAKLTASDGAPSDFLGSSTAIDANRVVAGAICATVDGNSCQGAAYVFVRPKHGWANETETAKLTASDGAANDLFGFSVAIDDSTLLAGAPQATVNGNANQGAVYVFDKRLGSMQTAAITRARRAHARVRLGRLEVCTVIRHRDRVTLTTRLLWLRLGAYGCLAPARHHR